jgi:hypothetical protein
MAFLLSTTLFPTKKVKKPFEEAKDRDWFVLPAILFSARKGLAWILSV